LPIGRADKFKKYTSKARQDYSTLTATEDRPTHLIPPYGGRLIDLRVRDELIPQLRADASRLKSIRLSKRSVCDLELLATGAFSPLDRFMGREDHERVLEEMRLSNGSVFPISVTLPVHETPVRLDQDVALRDERNQLLAIMTLKEIYQWDPSREAERIVGTHDMRHPLVAEMCSWGRLNITGALRMIHMPRHYDFGKLRLTPAETRERLERLGYENVVAFQTRNPLHRAHEELTKRATEQINGALLLHPVIGMTNSGDIDSYTRVRTYKALAANYFDQNRILLSLLPLAMRMAGPREALWHALIRRNYGANHIIIGRDHASPGVASDGSPYYPAYAAQELVERFSDEIGIRPLHYSEFVYLPDEDRYEERSCVPEGVSTNNISGTELRQQFLQTGRPLPPWFTRPEVAEILTQTYPPRHKQGVCIWFTGFSGAGKSTTADVLIVMLQEYGRQVTVLDGDVIRLNLCSELGFTREDRDLNIRRIGFVASEIVRHGGAVVCAAVSPYRSTRNEVRGMIGDHSFVEVFVDTPLEECERRDAKGLYAKARRGEIKNFTGIDDPYEPPQCPEIRIETIGRAPEENALAIISYLRNQGFLKDAQE
jgi:sulfate adenylyltransferase